MRPWFPPCRARCCAGHRKQVRSPWPIFTARRTARACSSSRAQRQTRRERGSALYLGLPTMQRITAYLQAACISGGSLFRRIRNRERVTRSPLTPASGRRRTSAPLQCPQPPGRQHPVTHIARGHAAGSVVGRPLAVSLHGGALRRRAAGRARRHLGQIISAVQSTSRVMDRTHCACCATATEWWLFGPKGAPVKEKGPYTSQCG